MSVGKNKPKEFSNDRPQLYKPARTSTNAGHVLAVRAAAHGDVLTFTATRDDKAVRALSVAFEGRRPVSDSTVAAIAARLVNALETYDRDAVETFADAKLLNR